MSAIRTILGLEDFYNNGVADGQSGAGWVFIDGASCKPWEGIPGPFFLHEVYQADDCEVSTQINLPVLWDTKME